MQGLCLGIRVFRGLGFSEGGIGFRGSRGLGFEGVKFLGLGVLGDWKVKGFRLGSPKNSMPP